MYPLEKWPLIGDMTVGDAYLSPQQMLVKPTLFLAFQLQKWRASIEAGSIAAWPGNEG
jgi:hypothetical protein